MYPPRYRATSHPRLPAFYSLPLFFVFLHSYHNTQAPFTFLIFPLPRFYSFPRILCSFSSPYLETPFCFPNRYPRMPSTPPSLAKPSPLPPARLETLLLLFSRSPYCSQPTPSSFRPPSPFYTQIQGSPNLLLTPLLKRLKQSAAPRYSRVCF